MSSSNFITTSSAGQFRSKEEFVQHVYSAVSEAKEHHIFVFTDVSKPWGLSALKVIDEVFAFRHTLDPYAHTLRLKVKPVLAHESIQVWLNRTLARWHYATQDLNQAEYDLMYGVANATFVLNSGPYVGWEKTPDFAIMVNGQRFPTVVAEAGWSEPCPGFLHDVNRLMVGGDGATNIAILFKWYQRSDNRRAADIQVFRKDGKNIPILIQEETVFPRPHPVTNQTIRITRGDLFGAARLQGRAASDVLSLDLELLRDEGTRMLHIMGFVPA